MTRPRVVSLLPSITETLRAWDLDPIACTRFCEQPDLRTVGGTKDPDVAAIVDLRPDLVVVDTEENRREDADALEAAGLELLVTDVHAVADVEPTLRRLGEALGLSWSEVAAGGGFVVDAGDQDRPADAAARAFVPIWRRPWMTINGHTYGSSLLRSVGVDNVFADAADRYPTVDALADVAQRDATVVLAPSEPYPFAERHRAELETVAPARFVDGRDLFWWGVRTIAARARLLS